MVLHAHLPFVRHIKDKNALEERWFYQALTECYIPLLNKLNRLKAERVDYKLTLSLSPPLLEMLADNLLQQRYLNYLNNSLELIKQVGIERNNGYSRLNKFYLGKLQEVKKTYLRYDYQLIKAFSELEKTGLLNLITTAATHGYLPLLQRYPQAIRSQISSGINTYYKHFNSHPEGFWLPECAYYPGLDKILKEYNIKYFFIENQGLLQARPYPKYGVFAPVYTTEAVAVFARDPAASAQVWSREQGYPGDKDYREFYCDLAHELEQKEVEEYVHPAGIRADTGIKYYAITDKNSRDKKLYNPKVARKKAASDAADFIEKRKKQASSLIGKFDKPPLVTAPYDAELFGHWWYEGPDFIYYLLKKVGEEPEIELITPDDYLQLYSKNQLCNLSLSSWGDNGYNDVWLNQKNHWVYKKLIKATERMLALVEGYSKANLKNQLQREALNQAGRELMLAQSSDWSFIITTGTTVDYAQKRINTHLDNFNKLYKQLKKDNIDFEFLKSLQKENNIFSGFDYKIYKRKNNS